MNLVLKQGWVITPDQPMYFTGIGSRDTPTDILALMEDIGWAMTMLGYILRSGGAEGADNAFWLGARSAKGDVPGIAEIYLPWKSFPETPGSCDILAKDLPTWGEAEKIASRLHPAWEKFQTDPKRYGAVMVLHTRNVFQILGQNLNVPSRVVYCWAPPMGTQGHVKGGTATAVKLALESNVKVVNLHNPEVAQRAREFVERVKQAA